MDYNIKNRVFIEEKEIDLKDTLYYVCKKWCSEFAVVAINRHNYWINNYDELSDRLSEEIKALLTVKEFIENENKEVSNIAIVSMKCAGSSKLRSYFNCREK